MSSAAADAVVIGRGFQLLSAYHFNHQIKCVAPQGKSVAVHCTVGSEHVTSVCAVAPKDSRKKISVEKAVQQLLYIRKYRLHVAFCSDLTIRVFSEHFQHIQTIHVTSTILSMVFIENTSILYTGESGFIRVWRLKPRLHCPLVAEEGLSVSVGKDQWVVSLDYEVETQRVAAASEDAVAIIDAQTHKETASYSSGHPAAITGALLYSSFDYLVISFKDGSIIALNTVLHTKVHNFSGHIKEVTGLKRHPMGSSALSCSLDGTVRVWDLNTLSECYRLDCGEEVVGMSIDFRESQLVCHSNQNVKIWQLSELESHFATVNSHVMALRRIESPGAARIMATAEDGCVRLLSPVTGEVITIFFPVFTAKIVSEVVYCPLGRLLFALLRTSEVLVLSAHSNPCSTVQLWTARERDRIESICMCLIEWREKVYSLLFGGGVSGYIFLLHSSHLTMPQPCPAHGGTVCQLACPDSPLVVSETSSSTPCLLSYGSDNFLNVWTLAVGDKGDFVSLKMQICIQMETIPKCLGILDTLLCVTTIKNSVKMLDISAELTKTMQQSRCLAHGCLFNSMPVLSHQREDCHMDTIISLSCSHSLDLFATSSRDGHLKVWSTSNQLVSDIHFGDTLTSACFSNARGDLLVGFQRQVCTVRAQDFLPPAYLQLSMECCVSDCAEDPITFDPTLQFWYDPERVPALPVQQTERSKYCTLTEFYSSGQQVMAEECRSRQSVEGGRNGVAASLSEVVDVQLSQSGSRSFLASVDQSGSSISETPLLSRSTSVMQSLSSLREAILNGLGTLRSDDFAPVLPLDRRQSLSRSAQPKRTTTQVKSFPAEVTPLKSSSCKFPIAPDCLIPNSTVREKIGYMPPPEAAILQKLLLHCQAKTDKLLNKATTAPHQQHHNHHSGNTPKEVLAVSTHKGSTATLEENVSAEPLMSAVQSGESVDTLSDDDDALGERAEICESFASTASESELSSSALQLPPNERTQKTENKKASVTTAVESSSSLRKSSVTSVQPSSPQLSHYAEKSPTVDGGGIQVSSSAREVERKAAHLNKAKLSTSQHEDQSTQPMEAKVVPTVTIPFQTGPMQTTTTTTPRDSVQSGTGGGRKRDPQTHEATEYPKENKGTKTLRRIMEKPWFPSSLKNTDIWNGIVSVLASADMPILGDIGSALVEMKEQSLLSEAQQSQVLDALVSRLASAQHSHTKLALLSTLEGLGVGTDSILLAILPSLVDPNKEVRNAAFSAQKTIAGISNRLQLHQTLIKIGVLQHVESDEDVILQELAQRLEKESLTRSGKGRQTDSNSTDTAVSRELHVQSHRGKQRVISQQGDSCHHSLQTLTEVRPDNATSNSLHSERQGQNSRTAVSCRGDGKGQKVALKTKVIHRAVPASQTSAEEVVIEVTVGQNTSETQRQESGHYKELTRPDLVLFDARLQRQPSLPFIDARRHDRLRGEAESRHTHSVPSRQRTEIGGGNSKQVQQLQKMLATHPISFSQTSPARDLIMEAYGTDGVRRRRRKTSRTATTTGVGLEFQRQFKWMEVFPVLRESSGSGARENREKRECPATVVARRDTVVLPKLAATCATEQESKNARERTLELKLPQIDIQ